MSRSGYSHGNHDTLLEEQMHQTSIPKIFQQLLTRPGSATFSVLGADGSIQSSLVWPDFDGELVKVNMVEGAPKLTNVRREGLATLLVFDPSDEDTYISLRCELANISGDGAIAHLDMLTMRNMNLASWYGDVEPADSPDRDKRVIVHLRPVRVYHT